MPLPSSVKVQHTHHARSYCMESFHAKLRFVSQAQRAHSWLQFVQAINADAEVLRAAVCNRCPVRYSRAEDVMTASLSSRTQQVLIVDISQLDTKLGESQVVWAGRGKITSGMAVSQDASLLCSHCSPSLKV